MTRKGDQMIRDLLLKAGPKRRNVEVDGVGSVTVRGLTAGEAVEFHKLQVSAPERAPYFLLTSATLDEKGNAMFGEADVAALADVDAQVVDVLVAAVLELSRPKNDTAEKK